MCVCWQDGRLDRDEFLALLQSTATSPVDTDVANAARIAIVGVAASVPLAVLASFLGVFEADGGTFVAPSSLDVPATAANVPLVLAPTSSPSLRALPPPPLPSAVLRERSMPVDPESGVGHPPDLSLPATQAASTADHLVRAKESLSKVHIDFLGILLPLAQTSRQVVNKGELLFPAVGPVILF